MFQVVSNTTLSLNVNLPNAAHALLLKSLYFSCHLLSQEPFVVFITVEECHSFADRHSRLLVGIISRAN